MRPTGFELRPVGYVRATLPANGPGIDGREPHMVTPPGIGVLR